MDLFGEGEGGGAPVEAAVGAVAVAGVANPASDEAGNDDRELEEDSNAENVPDLLLVQIYGGKLMQLSPFMPYLLVFFGMMNAYRRNYDFIPWELGARCYVDETAPFFEACREKFDQGGGLDGDAWDHCQAHFCRVRDETVLHPDTAIMGADVHGWAPWSEGKPCPTGFGQSCIPSGEIDPAELTPLNLLYKGLAGIASLFVGAVSFSLRRVTGPTGALVLLGHDEARISARAARSLRRWHVAMGGMIVLLFLFAFVVILVFNTDHWMEMPIYIFVWPSAFLWYLSLKEASILVSDAVLEARKLLVSTPVGDKEWDTVVVPAMLRLAAKTLPDLSYGFGTGLFMITTAFWLISASAFATGLAHMNFGHGFFRSFVLFCFPLLIALDVASASSACDSLVTALNEKRKLDMSKDTHQKLQILEYALEKENAGQGLGFVVLGTVVDRKTLSRIFFLVMGTLGTIGPIIMALRPTEPETMGGLCRLREDQREAIRAIATAVLGENATCSFQNVTLDYIMGA